MLCCAALCCRMQAQLQEFGVAGVVAYGLLNTLYYTCTFLFVWVYVAKVPQGRERAGSDQICRPVLQVNVYGSGGCGVGGKGGDGMD